MPGELLQAAGGAGLRDCAKGQPQTPLLSPALMQWVRFGDRSDLSVCTEAWKMSMLP